MLKYCCIYLLFTLFYSEIIDNQEYNFEGLTAYKLFLVSIFFCRDPYYNFTYDTYNYDYRFNFRKAIPYNKDGYNCTQSDCIHERSATSILFCF
jgi:hypothetical protein